MFAEDKDLELAEQEQELPPEIEEKRRKGALRTGYTTGTTATAATKGALYALIEKPVEQVTVSLPKGKTATIKIAWTRIDGNKATCAAIKDGGDDPDVTHGAEICSTVSLSDNAGQINIDGGKGVGRVTKPGLGLEIGKAAINPIPMKMLEQAVREVAQDQLKKHGVEVVISVPKGEEIAKRTDNPRLGILGGISILGTTGIVLPYSTASFAASIRQGLDVAIAMGADTTVLTTGGRSEDFAKTLFKLPDHCFVQMGDFAGYSIKQCASKKLRKAIIAGFIGKLTKMAMGVKQTHVAGSHVDMEFMARLAAECKAPPEVVQEIRGANTARHVSEIITKNNVAGYFDLVCKKVHEQMSEHSKRQLDIEVVMFEFDGQVIGRHPPLDV
ncbi:cobalt-precorrin-6A synthase [Candidatus Nitrososphaera gargensis Ga9.2]|uniref:Cobalt-precorrin-5B C(1)-methyltransferase n=1 Tax=Nitrososphaera gargensis (strain Ga9.2) TaxID=1237085 RepID=K0IG27_NITGG|nr:cobalt-precorrin-5B (C(1))-methyltransferase [Candidatus Nitrososphaera gargensis]AFU58740.1 cobalt-precorrin-6A synthase [Candidatus Nitrososphaera gargensis Ga9.2]